MFEFEEFCAGINKMACNSPAGACATKCDGIVECMHPNDEANCRE